MLDLGLKGKSVLVLAASKGLGKATAAAFAREEARVMLASRDADALARAAYEIEKQTGRKVPFTAADITRPEDIRRLVRETSERFGTIDVLVNNAGGPPAGTFEQFADEDWYHAFELNLLSYIRTIREVLPLMKKQGGGRIVNFASASTKQALDNLILSNTFRSGIVGLAKSLSIELGNYGILINTIGPGRIATDRIAELDEKKAEATGQSVEEIRKTAEMNIPLGRSGEPEEFAKIAVFLGSYANTYVTGQTFLVDGGMVKAI